MVSGSFAAPLIVCQRSKLAPYGASDRDLWHTLCSQICRKPYRIVCLWNGSFIYGETAYPSIRTDRFLHLQEPQRSLASGKRCYGQKSTCPSVSEFGFLTMFLAVFRKLRISGSETCKKRRHGWIGYMLFGDISGYCKVSL